LLQDYKEIGKAPWLLELQEEKEVLALGLVEQIMDHSVVVFESAEVPHVSGHGTHHPRQEGLKE
jgi:hypothetical protein